MSVNPEYPIHPAAEIFPMMGDREFAEFKRDIETYGVKEWGTLYRGQVLDGRNRYKACQELGIEMTFCEIEDSEDFDPFAYVLSHNLYRRHLNESQRGMVAAKLAKLKIGDVASQRGVSIDTASIDEASKQLNVGRATTARAKKVIAEGSEQLQQAVEQGALPVSVASDFVKHVPDKAEQVAILEQGEEAVKAKVKQSKKQETAPEPSGVSKNITQNNKSVEEFLIVWGRANPRGKRAIWLWLCDNYEGAT